MIVTALAAPAVVDLELDRTWTYGADTQHGGHLLQMVVGAGLRDAAHSDPLAATAHFLSPAQLGEAQVHVQTLRAGRSVSTVHARLMQGDATRLDVVVTAGRLGEPGQPSYVGSAPPRLPPLDQCGRTTAMAAGHRRNGIVEQLDMRIDPATIDRIAERAEVAAWVRYADGRDAEPLDLLCMADALPPVTFAMGLHGWVPTIELTVHVRARPAAGWLRIVQRADLLLDGWLDETCEIWDRTGRLVAQGHQLAAYRG